MGKDFSTKKLLNDMALFILLSAIALFVTSLFLIRDDVHSTAQTILIWFPAEFGVEPASDELGAWMLGAFVSLAQVVMIAIALNDNFSMANRISATIGYIVFMVFDGFTDVTHRSQFLTGDIWVSVGITIAFYTLGAELLTGYSSMLVGQYWRRGVSDILLMLSSIIAFFKNVHKEWENYQRASKRREEKYIGEREKEVGGGGYDQKGSQPPVVNQGYTGANQIHRQQPHQQAQQFHKPEQRTDELPPDFTRLK